MEVQPYSFFNFGVNGGGWLAPRPGRFTTGKNTRYRLYKMLGVPQARCGRVRTNSPHLQFCILLYSVCTSSLLGSFSWLSCILPFVCTYNTQHKHPCLRRDFFCLFSALYLYCFVLTALALPFVLLVQNTHNTNIQAPGGIRTCNPSKRSAADPRLRPLDKVRQCLTLEIRSPDHPASSESL